MSRLALLARMPRPDEAAWVEADPALRVAANETSRAALQSDGSAPADHPVPSQPHGGLPARTALWFWAEPSSLE
jgi:hypothetical protein